MTGGRFDASVVIPAHNAEDQIGEQLSALASQEGAIEFEVVVVLNRCTDATEAVVDGFRDRLHVRSIRADEQASAAYARNVGAANAHTDVLLYCDADDRAGELWVVEMCTALRDVDFVGGRLIIDLDGVPRWRHAKTGAHPVHGGLHLWDARMLYPITASFGCRRSAFEAIGGFDEGFAGAASEDIDLAMSLYRAGFRMGFAPEATLKYRPRRNLRQMLRQSRTYANGDALLAAKEGRLIPVGHLRSWAQMAAATASKAASKPTLSPKALYLAAAKVRYRTQAWRRLSAQGDIGDQQPDPIVDYVVRLPGEADQWLAFSDHRDAARSRFRGGRDLTVLRTVDEVLRSGGSMLDLDPEGGVAAVVAAAAVGPSGTVVCCEADQGRRAIVEANVARHGVGNIVEVSEQVDLTRVTDGFDVVRLDRQLAALPQAADYVGLVEATGCTSVLVPADVVGPPTSAHPLHAHFTSGDWVLGDPGPLSSDYVLATRR